MMVTKCLPNCPRSEVSVHLPGDRKNPIGVAEGAAGDTDDINKFIKTQCTQ